MRKLLKTLSYITSHPINRRHKLKAVWDFFRWQLGSRMLQGENVFEWIHGTKLVVGSGEAGLTGNIYTGLHEFVDMAFLLHHLREDELFVDVGANRGSYTILASGACKAKVVAFEPIPDTHAKLETNVRINHLEASVECLNVGLADQPGRLQFVSSDDAMNRVAVEGSDASRLLEVEVSTLDTILGQRSPSLMKIDVEGYELPVIQGARELLGKESLEAIIMETNDSGNRYGYDNDELLGILASYDFTAYDYSPFDRRLTPKAAQRGESCNTIFVRDMQQTQGRLAEGRRFKVRGCEF